MSERERERASDENPKLRWAKNVCLKGTGACIKRSWLSNGYFFHGLLMKMRGCKLDPLKSSFVGESLGIIHLTG